MTTNNPFLELDQQFVGDIYTSAELMDNLLTLCDEFGSRFGGTEGERQAAEFMEAKLKAYGLSNVHREPFEYLRWLRGEAKLEIIEPIQREIPCITLPYSPPTTLEGVIVDAGNGFPADFERLSADIEGRIVMANSRLRLSAADRWVHRGEKYGRSLMAGATGFIFVNHYPGYGPATGGISDGRREAFIPGFSLAKEDGDFIQRLIQRKGAVKVRLTSTDRFEPATSWNVIGDLPGQSHPDEMVILGCHYDGHDIAQGASDPASGTVAVMEAARVLAKYPSDLPRTVRFALWGLEEIGLVGSRHYVKAHADELSQVRFYLNMDAAGSHYNGVRLNDWPSLQPLIEGWSQQMAREIKVDQMVHAFSDHYPFFLAGVPTGGLTPVGVVRTGRGYGHTQYDTVDKIELATLRDAAELGARLAVRLSHEANWPVARRDEAAVQATLAGPTSEGEAAYQTEIQAFFKERGVILDPAWLL